MSKFAKFSLLSAAVVAVATLVGAVAPASAHDWGGRGGWGWGWGGGPRFEERRGWDHGWGGEPWRYRPHCWIETRPQRVWTPWGPRWQETEVRFCR